MEQDSILDALMRVIAERKSRPAGGRSYVRTLLDGGTAAIGAKVREEAAELVAAADEPGDAGRAHLVHEAADLVFHALVLLGHRDISWAEVESELARRFGVSGLDEKAARGATTD
jgi:phosphoribosyl-ATP pyrophosphohydrolase